MNVRIQELNIPLKQPFAYFLNTLTSLPYALVEIETPGGLTGKGEAPCAIDINGEIPGSAPNLAPYIAHAIRQFDLDTISSTEAVAAVMSRLDLVIAFNAATKCAVEQALFDILSQKTGRPLAGILGARKETVKVQANIPFLADVKEYEKAIAETLAKGPDHVKFKIGRNTPLEARAMNMLRSIAPDIGITADANQAFASAADAAAFLRTLGDVRLSWAEQFIGKHDIDGWRELKTKTDVPLMADESVQTISDALLFMQNGWIDILNLKIGKCGGIINARKIARLAEEFGIPVMLGSMLEGELGTKYNLAYALSGSFITHDFYHYFSLAELPDEPLIDPKTLHTTKKALS